MSDFTKDDSGNVIDPPVLAEHEQAIAVAAASGDNDAIQYAQEAYDVARQEVVDRKDQKAQDEERAIAEQEVSDRENRRREKSDAEGNWTPTPTPSEGDPVVVPPPTAPAPDPAPAAPVPPDAPAAPASVFRGNA